MRTKKAHTKKGYDGTGTERESKNVTKNTQNLWSQLRFLLVEYSTSSGFVLFKLIGELLACSFRFGELSFLLLIFFKFLHFHLQNGERDETPTPQQTTFASLHPNIVPPSFSSFLTEFLPHVPPLAPPIRYTHTHTHRERERERFIF